MAKCIVVFDIGDGCWPATKDSECVGAICFGDGPVIVFADKKAARKAINISTQFARLRQSQGLAVNTDMTGDYRKCVKIVPVVEVGETEG